MSERIKIRLANDADHDALIGVWKSALATGHAFLQEGDRLFYERRLPLYFAAVSVYVAELNGRIVGFVGVHEASIEMLFVAADAQRLGVGSALLCFAVERLGADRVDVNEQNRPARVFYERHGFQVQERSPVDGEGKAYPILHLAKVVSSTRLG